MTTLPQLQALSGDQLIEKVALDKWRSLEPDLRRRFLSLLAEHRPQQFVELVAVEVMGWHRNYGFHDPKMWVWATWQEYEGERMQQTEACADWNPLIDWNRTMEVMKAAAEKLGDAFYAAWEETEPAEIWSREAQRAICLAALLAVSHD